jgi:NADH-quinone oxidoreductase subunit J
MSASSIFFYFISAFILAMGLLAVTSKKIFRSAIWLLFCLVGIAGLFFWMQLEFLAAVQIVVYAGGIVVLIIFSIFLTQRAGTDLPRPATRRIMFSILATGFGFALTYSIISRHPFSPRDKGPLNASVTEIGTQMLGTGRDGYALPFEVVSILLLAAMIGCIVIAMKSPAINLPARERKGEPEKLETNSMTV